MKKLVEISGNLYDVNRAITELISNAQYEKIPVKINVIKTQITK